MLAYQQRTSLCLHQLQVDILLIDPDLNAGLSSIWCRIDGSTLSESADFIGFGAGEFPFFSKMVFCFMSLDRLIPIHSLEQLVRQSYVSPKAGGSVLCISDREDEAYLLGNYRGNGTPWVERCQLPELICHLSAATRTDGNNKRISIQNWDDCGINYLQRHQNLLHVHNNKLLVDMNMGVAVYQILSPANTLVRASVDLSK